MRARMLFGASIVLAASGLACPTTPLPHPAARPAPLPASSLTSAEQIPRAALPTASSNVAASASSASEKPAPPVPRIGSIKWYTYIWPEPHRGNNRLAIGGIRFGTTIPLRSPTPVPGSGCVSNRWYAVEPFGYICDDDTTTLEFDTPYWRALSSVAPKPGPYPYRYAYSVGAPMYSRVPTPEEQERAEQQFGPRRTFFSQGKWAKGHEWLVSSDPNDAIEPTDDVPDFFRNHATIPGSPYRSPLPKVRTLPAGSGVAYAKAFSAAGRTWLLTPELLLVPADRVFPYKRQTFHGVQLGKGIDLPLAWIRSKSEKKLRKTDKGTFEETGDAWTNKSHVRLTGSLERRGPKTRYWETHEPGIWVMQRDGITDGAVVVQGEKRLPGGVSAGERWVDARIMTGFMVAYVGLEPVWTTLWSGGKGGVAVGTKNPADYAMTEAGNFQFQWKEHVHTMSPERGVPTVFWFSDVPHIQYVKKPLAMHTSYWHDNYGNLMSAECLNLSPIDAHWMFEFTLPHVPKGWTSVRGSRLTGPATRIVIRPW